MATTPPKMITPKDRLYLEDLLNVSLVYHKKAVCFSNMVKDDQARKVLNEVSTMLSQHYDELLDLLKSGSNQRSGSVTKAKVTPQSTIKGGSKSGKI